MSDEELKSDEILDLARRFLAAYTARDKQAIAALYQPDAVIWHNSDGIELSVQRHIDTFIANTKPIVSFEYAEVRVHPFVGGYVQQHRSRGVTTEGKELDVDTCIVVLVREGRISRMDEYRDSDALRKAGAEPVH